MQLNKIPEQVADAAVVTSSVDGSFVNAVIFLVAFCFGVVIGYVVTNYAIRRRG